MLIYKGMYMFESRIEENSIDEVAQARKAKNSLDALSPFLNCQITPVKAREYVDVLMKHDMLYYFEQDANEVVICDENSSGVTETIFTSKQATMLNVIRNRFMEDERSFQALFNAVWCSDDDAMEYADVSACEQRIDEYEIVDRIMPCVY